MENRRMDRPLLGAGRLGVGREARLPKNHLCLQLCLGGGEGMGPGACQAGGGASPLLCNPHPAPTPSPRPPAQALDCHVCAYNGENCFNPMRCPAMVTYCMTTRTYYTPTRMKVSKSCVPSCFETVYDGYSKHASTTSCCQYDLCNSAGLAVPGALALAPILLATVWGLL
uniref:Ly-6/neurotoxin-like protein 1 n=1 Tax=Lynx canadensis TaxID=61383 RepID=A0A667HUJ7_LYNCA